MKRSESPVKIAVFAEQTNDWEALRSVLATQFPKFELIRVPEDPVRQILQAQAALRDSEQRYRLLFERNVAGVFRSSLNGEMLEVNEAFAEMLGYGSPVELRGILARKLFLFPEERTRLVDQLKRDGCAINFECGLRRSDGQAVWVMENSVLMHDPELGQDVIVGTLVDLTEKKQLEVKLKALAYRDPLTGLANRRYLEEQGRRILSEADREDKLAALIYLDLARFKRVNDTFGHDTGDQLLVEAADRLERELRKQDVAARVGGDEFAVLLPNIASGEQALSVAKRLADKLHSPYSVEGNLVHIEAQLGISLYPQHAQSFEKLLIAADMAMYQTKIAGSQVIEFFSPDTASHFDSEMDVESSLRKAIEENELTVYYQPIFDLRTGGVVAAEALVRWMHPQRSLLNAGDFIRLAERSGLIRRLDWLVLEMVAREVENWSSGNLEWFSVNLSVFTIQEPGFISNLSKVLKIDKSPREGCFVFEITESQGGRDLKAMCDDLQQLRDMGIRIALDDFGTGHSGLAYLQNFPVDFIKMDRCFIQELKQEDQRGNVARAIVQLGQGLGVRVIAEGIETVEQYDWLKAAGCELGQGRYLGPPAKAEEFSTTFIAPKD